MRLNPVEIIRKKRDGHRLSEIEIRAFISGAAKGEIPEYQVTAWLMATYFQGMTLDETCALTQAMIESGQRIVFADSRPKIDKHSTGGVGDKVSLILAPLVAVLGVDVPMVSGRGLGHTGGTLDKLESIPGFRVNLRPEEFVRLVAVQGLAMMGQTADFVPADKLLYALRDVTATVESIPLITASILSKKKAEGITGLVLDIKVGNGAFMKSQKDAERLAKSLVDVGTRLGLKVRAVLSDMNQPLGLAVGHSLEVLECLEVLEGRGPSDLKELTVELAAQMLVLGEKSSSLSGGRAMAKQALRDGRARERFSLMCKNQGAAIDPVRNPEKLPLASQTAEIPAPRSGILQKIDTQRLGMLLIRLGGGRVQAKDTIDPGVGFLLKSKLGARLEMGEPLAKVYYDAERLRAQGTTLESFSRDAANCFELATPRKKTVAGAKLSPPPLIKKVINPDAK